MHRVIILLLVAALAGCSINVHGGAYHPLGDTRKVFRGEGAVMKFEATAARQYTERLSGNCSYMHVSNFTSGAPFNKRREDFIDAVGCGVTYTLFR